MCWVKSDNEVIVTSFMATGASRPTLKGDLAMGNMKIAASYENGVLRCSFRRTITVPSGSEMWMVDLSQPQYTLWAEGNVMNDVIQNHTPNNRQQSNGKIDLQFKYMVRWKNFSIIDF